MSRVTLSGKLATGVGEGAFFTGLAWARAQLIDRLGIDPFPGTLNLRVDDAAERDTWDRVKSEPGERLASPNPDGCDARCYRVRIAGEIDGAIVLPEVPGYAPDQIEIVAAVGLRERLEVNDGDRVTIEVEIPSLCR